MGQEAPPLPAQHSKSGASSPRYGRPCHIAPLKLSLRAGRLGRRAWGSSRINWQMEVARENIYAKKIVSPGCERQQAGRAGAPLRTRADIRHHSLAAGLARLMEILV